MCIVVFIFLFLHDFVSTLYAWEALSPSNSHISLLVSCDGFTSHFLCDLDKLLNLSGLPVPQNEGVGLNQAFPKPSEILPGQRRLESAHYVKCSEKQYSKAKWLSNSTAGSKPKRTENIRPHTTRPQGLAAALFLIIKRWVHELRSG